MERWSNLGGSFINQPCALSVDSRRLAIFGVGTDHGMYVRWRDSGEWGDWESLGGALIAAPMAVRRRSGCIDLFCVSHDQSICHRHWEGRWGPWRTLHGVVGGIGATATPTVAIMNHEDFIVFRLATDLRGYGKIHSSQRWGEWEDLDAAMMFPPSAAQTPGGLQALAVRTDGRLLHAIRNQSEWQAWQAIGNDLVASAPRVAHNGAGRLDVYYLHADRQLFRRSWDGSWGDLECLEGTITEVPAVVASPGDRADIFVVGEDRAVWYRSLTADRRTWWRSLGGQAFAPISAMQQGSGRVELFTLGRDCAIWHRTFAAHDS
jgi:hypothetical protein